MTDAIIIQVTTIIVGGIGTYFLARLNATQETIRKSMTLQFQLQEKAAMAAQSSATAAAAAVREVKQTLSLTAEETANAVSQVRKTLHATATETAAAVHEVKQALADTATGHGEQLKVLQHDTGELKVVTAATHTLVNNNMVIQLHINQAISRRLADLTHDPDDIQAAEEADQLYREHQSRQAIVDKQNGTDDEKKGISISKCE